MQPKRFTDEQKRALFACILAYGGAYVSRLNIAQALPEVSQAFGLTPLQAGVIPAVFSLCYAFGQLINGMIVDRVNAKRCIYTGMLASSLCNMMFGASNTYRMLLAAWCLNGAAQSMLWTPVIKILSTYFYGEQRKRVTFTMSIAMLIGNMIAWIIASQMINLGTWRMAFYLPGAITALLCGGCFLLIRGTLSIPKVHPAHRSGQEAMPLVRLVFSTGLVFILMCTCMKGFVRDGIMTWGPTILLGAGGPRMNTPAVMSLIIPVVNITGIVVGRRVFIAFRSNALRMIAFTMVFCGLVSLLLFYTGLSDMLVCALLLGTICAAMSAVGPLDSTYIPMNYDQANRVGTVTGMVDCFQYLGSSLSGVLTGALTGIFHWKGVFMAWVVMCILSACMALLGQKRFSRFEATGVSSSHRQPVQQDHDNHARENHY